MLLSALLSAKAVAAVGGAVVVLTAGTTAAAYAGVLPEQLQKVAAQTVGAPDPSESPDPTAATEPTESESPDASETPDADESPEAKASPSAEATDPASFGLCNAREHGGLPEHSQGYAKLVAIAGTSTVADYCVTVLGQTPSPEASPTESESETAAAAPTAPGKSGQHGKAAEKKTKTHGRSAAARS